MPYNPPQPSAEEQKKWPCRFHVHPLSDEHFVPSIMERWEGDLSDRPIEQMKHDVEETVNQCMVFLRNCVIRVDVLKYNELRNTWPIHTTYHSDTRTWTF